MASFPTYQGGLGTCCPPSTMRGVALRTIKSQIIDEFGDPVQGVSITVQGENGGTTSDSNGIFILKDVPINAIVTFSHVSIVTEVIALRIEDKVEINTIFMEDAIEIQGNPKKNNTMKYVGYGLLALVVLYGVSRMGGSKAVKASI